MQFSPQKLLIMHEEYLKAPKATTKIPIPFRYVPPGERFDILKYFSYVPKERLQGCGDCWVWACTGALEIDRAVRKGIKERLSIQWFNSNCKTPCCSGWPPDFAKIYSGPLFTINPIPWSNTNAYYHKNQKGSSLCSCAVPPDDISATPHYSIEYCEAQVIPTTDVGKEGAIANIKEILKQNKAVIFLFFFAPVNNFRNFWGTENENAVWHFENWNCGGKECHDKRLEGHAVLCVGYDDRDPKNRYWIMVNSWPTNSDDLIEEQKKNYPHINRPNNIFLVSMEMDYDSKYWIPTGFDTIEGKIEVESYFFQWWTFEVSSAGDGVGFFNGDINGGSFKLDKNINGGIDQEISYAKKVDKPIKGDWNNDGIDEIGYFRPIDHTFHLDNNFDGKDDKILSYGKSADLPLSGKWRQMSGAFSAWWLEPQEGIGYFRPSDHTFHLDQNLDRQDDVPPISYGSSNSVPLSGDWDGDGFDGIGYYSPFRFHISF
jgi:hypothetical protein